MSSSFVALEFTEDVPAPKLIDYGHKRTLDHWPTDGMLFVLLIMTLHSHELLHLAAATFVFILLTHYHELLYLVSLGLAKVMNDRLKKDGYPLPIYADGELLLLILLGAYHSLFNHIMDCSVSSHLTVLSCLFNQEACIWKVILKRNLAEISGVNLLQKLL